MIDKTDLDSVVHDVSLRLRSHGGGIELTAVNEVGDVSVRFTGMCCGCPYKALTWRGTVHPMLSRIDGVTSVDAPGIRISEEAEERLQRYAATPYERTLATGSVRRGPTSGTISSR